MKIAYNPTTAAALTAAPSNNDITFDLKGVAVYAKGVKFKGTDTTYSVFKKHTASGNTGGYNGLVPVPSYTTTTVRFLREDGTWATPAATAYNVVSSTANGLAPAIGTTCSTTIATQADEWVLTSTKGGTPTWRKLPANAFKNDNTNTTYTLSGGLSGNNYTVTLTPSSGSATTATIPVMTAATSSAAGKAGLVPAPAANQHTLFLKGDGTWATPSDTHWTTHLYIGAKDAASNAVTTNGNTYIKVTDNSTVRNQYIIKGSGITAVASDANGNITINTPASHNQPTSDINKLTGYAIATSAAALATTDTLNVALGKLEYKLNIAYDLVTKANDGDGTIENLKEILDVLSGISDTETIKALVGKYLPLAGGTMNNGATIKFNANGGLIQTTATTSNATALIQWYKGTAKDANYSHAAQIGWHNTGDTDGAIYLVPNPQNSNPWGGSVGLYIGKTSFKWNNNVIIHSGNYTTYTVKKDGTGASGTWNISISGNSATSSKLNMTSITSYDGLTPVGVYGYTNTNNDTASNGYPLANTSAAIAWGKDNCKVILAARAGQTSSEVYIRQYYTAWGSWFKLLHSGNTYISNGTITINGTSITPLTSHQSLANYVTLNTAQTISGVKTFSTQQKFTVAQGTSPFTVTSNTKVANLNADLLDGYDSSAFVRISKIANSTNLNTLTSNLLYYTDTDGNTATMTNAPWTKSFMMLQLQGYSSGDDIRRYRLAINGYGDARLFNDRDTANTGGTWVDILTSKNYTTWINTTNFPGLNKTGTVTSVTVTGANGLSGTGTITTSGTITLSNAGVRSTTINGNYLRVNTNGTNADLTIPYATKAKQDVDGNDFKTTYLRKVSVANNTTNDFNTFENMTLTGRGDPKTGASLSNAPWSGSGPAGGYGVLTYLWSGYGTQMAWGYNSNRIYIRNKYYNGSTTVWSSTWDSLALTSDIPTVTNYYWANIKVSTSSSTSTQPTFYHTRIQGSNPALYIRNTSTAADTYSIIRFGNSDGDNKAYIFLNGPSRTDDGGANMMTIRNNVGDLRLNNNVLVTGSLNVNSKLITNTTGMCYANNTSERRAGMYGVYDSTKVGHVWSMGTGYTIAANGSNTGNMYGLVYFHTNWSNSTTYNDASKTEVSIYASNHQIAHVINGKVYASLGDYVWSRNGFKKNGSSNSYVLLGGGGHKALSDFMLKSEILTNNLTTISKSLTVTQAWMDTGIKYTDLPATGTYIVQVYVHDTTDGIWYNYWSGIMSWYRDGTNDNDADEILLHRAGHAYSHTIYLRTIMTANSDGRHLRLQIAADTNLSTAATYTFKFKRII